MRKQLTKKILHQWDNTIPDGLEDRIKIRQSRRGFLKATSLLAASLLLPACDNVNNTSSTKTANSTLLTQAPWQTFTAVQNHLFPKDSESPGADDINATLYLKSVLEIPGIEDADKKFLRDGIGWINGIAIQMFNNSFHELDKNNKEAVLIRIASSSAGENWLSLLLLYIFEALLTDPVYGGNPDGIGWQWLEHKPGFPSPTKDKRYHLLR